MAYSKAPTQDTYSQHTIPAFYDLWGGHNDASLGNPLNVGTTNLLCVEYKPSPQVEAQIVSRVRPAITGGVVDSGNTSGLIARGSYVWQKTTTAKYFYVVVGTKVYTSTDGETWVLKHTLTTSATTPVRFCEFIDSATNTKTLVMVDGVQGFTFATDAAGTEIVDAQFPTPHLPFPVYLDGYLFLAKPDTGDIYNSDLNNEESWTAGNFISSELYPDDIKAIVKVDNFLLAIGSQGSEYFYDAANATSSPLKRVDGASLPFGTYAPYTIACNEDSLIFLANSADGEMSLKYIHKMEHTDITPQFLIPEITSRLVAASSTLVTTWGYFLRVNGDLLYVLKQGVSATTIGDAATLVYSTKYKQWMHWGSGTTQTVSSTVRMFPVHLSTQGSINLPTNYVAGNINNFPFFARVSYTTDASNPGRDDISNTGLATDTIGIFWEIRTPVMTFGTLNLKTFSRLGVFAVGGNLRGYQVTVKSVDNDYITSTYTSNSTLYILPSTSGDEGLAYPFVTQLGKSRKRAFIINNDGISKSGAPVLYSIEVDINKGVQ